MNRVLPAYALLLAVLGGLAACEPVRPDRPPITVSEYDNMLRDQPQQYPRHTILLHNLQRVLDTDLPPEERMESLRLADRLGGGDPDVQAQLASILTQPGNPAPFREAVLTFLLKKDYPGLASHVTRALPQLAGQPALKEAVLTWLAQHPTPGVLSEVVKVWADEPNASAPAEAQYRQIVVTVSGKRWDRALLDALNEPGFRARGSALEVLSRRLPRDELRRQLAGMAPRTEAVEAMRAFADLFGYVPTDREQLATAAWLYRNRKGRMTAAAELAGKWQDQYRYRFNIRDFHLLSRLSSDPLRNILNRTQLVLEISRALVTREHVARRSGADDAAPSDRFADNEDRLSIADLWNLYLLNEMLTRPRIQLALRVMSLRDQSDARSAWGGLVFYENGVAEAKLYWSDKAMPADDTRYHLSAGALQQSRDALCWFHAHFRRWSNADRAGPTDEELAVAKEHNLYGLTLTSINDSRFCAHYYNPQGVVVSLGVFPFRK